MNELSETASAASSKQTTSRPHHRLLLDEKEPKGAMMGGVTETSTASSPSSGGGAKGSDDDDLDKAAERAVKQIEQQLQDSGVFSREVHNSNSSGDDGDDDESNKSKCSTGPEQDDDDDDDDEEVEGVLSPSLAPGAFDELVQGQEMEQEAAADEYEEEVIETDDDLSYEEQEVVQQQQQEPDGDNRGNGAAAAPVGAAALGGAAGDDPAGQDGHAPSTKPDDDPVYIAQARVGAAAGDGGDGGDPAEVVEHVQVDHKPDADPDGEVLPDAESDNGDKHEEPTTRDRENNLKRDDGEEGKGETTENDDQDTEKTEEELEEERHRRRRRRLLWLLLSLLLCLLILLFALLAYFMTREDEEPPSAPTPAPTEDPVTLVGSWVQKFPTLEGPKGAMFGASVGLDANYMTSGSPMFESRGTVFTAVYDDFEEGDWIIKPTLFGENVGDNFGAALDLVGERMVVGAPTKLIEGTRTQGGAVYYYEFNDELQEWDQVGPVIQGDNDPLAAGGEFGAAVSVGISVDLVPRVVVGAPKHNGGVDQPKVGKVYTYQGGDETWTPLEGEALLGKEPNDRFGASLDMSDDGTRFIVGAPGDGKQKGYARIYEWNGSGWSLDFEAKGTTASEQFGASVTSLTETVFAVGAPGFNSFSGRVVIYERKGAGKYEQIGEIEGEFGDLIGMPYSISGGLHDDGFNPEQFVGDEVLILVLAKAKGQIDTYGYDARRNVWAERVSELETGMEDLVVSYSFENGLMWGSGVMDQFSVLEFVACDPENEETGDQCAFGCNPDEEWCAFQPAQRRYLR